MKTGSKCYNLALRIFSSVRYGELDEAISLTKELLTFLEEQKKLKEFVKEGK